MSNRQPIRSLVIGMMIFSILYVLLAITMLMQGPSWKFYIQLVRIAYGLALFVLGIRLLFCFIDKGDLERWLGRINNSSAQNILDENLEEDNRTAAKRAGMKIDFIISCIHLGITLFLIFGELVLGVEYATIMVIGIVYAAFLTLLGLGQFS